MTTSWGLDEELQRVGYGIIGRLNDSTTTPVFRVSDRDGGSLVVKVASVDGCPRAAASLLREARILGSCRHDTLPRLVSTQLVDRLLVVAMQERAGIPVHLRLAQGRPPFAVLTRMLRRLAEGLQVVHDAGFLHGDIAGQNVLIADDGTPTLLDFGLARPWPSPAEHQVAGTIEYLAPEAFGGDAGLTPATDVYALGVLGFLGAAGVLPHVGSGDRRSDVRTRLATMPLPLAALVPSVPKPFADTIADALAPDPRQRIPAAAAFAERLSEVMCGWR